VFGGDPDAGVAHRECKLGGAVGRSRAYRDHDLALFRELDRVADQVHEHLAQAGRVAAHRARHVGCHFREQLEMLFARPHGEQAGRGVHHLRYVERDRFELQVLGFDLGVVEDVVQDHQERFRRRAYQLQGAALLGRQLGIEDQLHEAEHGVHRGADLVAHVREERRTGPGKALGEVARLTHHRFGALGGLLAHGQAGRDLEVIDQRQVRASRHDRHSQREQGHDDRGREMMGLIARGQRDEDGQRDAGEESADAQGIGREGGQRTGDETGQDDEEERRRLERDDRQDQRTAHAPGDGEQGHRGPHAVADRPLGEGAP